MEEEEEEEEPEDDDDEDDVDEDQELPGSDDDANPKRGGRRPKGAPRPIEPRARGSSDSGDADSGASDAEGPDSPRREERYKALQAVEFDVVAKYLPQKGEWECSGCEGAILGRATSCSGLAVRVVAR